MKRPLADAKVPEWRRYADHLEGLLAEKERDPGVSIWGIPIIEDSTMPAGQAELRWHGVPCARIVGLDFFGRERLPKDFMDDAMLRRVMPDAKLIFKAFNRARMEHAWPDEIRIHLVPEEGDEQ